MKPKGASIRGNPRAGQAEVFGLDPPGNRVKYDGTIVGVRFHLGNPGEGSLVMEMEDDDLKRIKRFSRKQVPRKQEREITPRHHDPRKARYAAKDEILRALEEDEENEDLLEELSRFEDDPSPEESEEDPEQDPKS